MYDKELEAARKLGEEMFDLDGRIIDAESSHRPSPVKQKRGDEPKRKRGTRQQPRSANEQDTPPLQLTLELTPVKVCYGCGGELMKPGGCVTNPPSDFVIVSGDKRSYDTQAKQIKQSDAITNVSFHLTPTCVF